MSNLVEQLLASNSHIGTMIKNAHSKTKNYWSGSKNNIVLIDLEQTANQLESAKNIVSDVKAQNGQILLICEKSMYSLELISLTSIVDNLHYFDFNTPSGVLTNFDTLKNRIKSMNNLEEFVEGKNFKALTKKEQLTKTRELLKVKKIYKGAKNLKTIPDLTIIVDGKAHGKFIDEIAKTHKKSIVLSNTDFNRYWDNKYNGELVITNVSNFASLDFAIKYIFGLI